MSTREVRRLVRRAMLVPLLAAFAAPAALTAQAESGGLPGYAPISPIAASRSPLRFEPYRAAAPGWSVAVDLDYASSIEANVGSSRAYLLDAEFLRADLAIGRDVARALWLELRVPVVGAYSGFLDAPLDWYHERLGIGFEAREERPANQFAYSVRTPRLAVDLQPTAAALGDLRITGGIRHGASNQTALTVTLPTSTAPDGYGRGVPGIGITHTIRRQLGGRVVYEGSIGAGHTPRTGPLAEFQRRWFAAATSGLRVQIGAMHALYANGFLHSPYYAGSGFPALDRRELSVDFGWIVRSRSGRELRLGLVEDLEPAGAGIDVVLRIARNF